MPGDAADARGNFLDRHHQRKAQQHGPADAVTELRAGLAVRADPRRIVVRGTGDQSRSERLDKIAQAETADAARPLRGFSLPQRRVLRIRCLAICHARSSRRDNEPDSHSVPGQEPALGSCGRQATVFMRRSRLDDGRDTRLQDFQTRAKTQRIEGRTQVAGALAEMRQPSRRKSFHVAAEPLCAGFGGQDAFDVSEKFLARTIEIVRMLVVAEQHRIDLAEVFRALSRRARSASPVSHAAIQ